MMALKRSLKCGSREALFQNTPSIVLSKSERDDKAGALEIAAYTSLDESCGTGRSQRRTSVAKRAPAASPASEQQQVL